ALNILALGTTRYLSKFTFEDAPQGSSKQSPPIDSLGTFDIPGLSSWLQTLNEKHWFLVSDIAGLVGGLVTNLSPLTVVAVALVPATWWVLWRTAFGLRLRSCGENPVAAESLGVNVYKYKYIAVIVSGGFAGLGGAFLSIVASNVYLDGQTAGRGYIGLAAMIFGNWMPGGLALGAGLFGYTDSLNLRGGTTNVHALILLLAMLLVVGGVYLLWRRKLISGVITLVISAVMFLWYAGTDEVPRQVVTAAPYVVTLLVLSLSAQRLRMPKADGLPYRKGQGK
ncbi:ABC transporter permease, partial [Streptomyces albogriseolus]